MKIQSLSYFNRAREWRLERTTFSDLTLLVGISGVGKTQILNALMSLKSIARGKNVPGVEWDLEFATDDGSQYRWIGAFESVDTEAAASIFGLVNEDEDKTPKAGIEREELLFNGAAIITRSSEGIFLREQRTPRLSPHESALNLLKEEDQVSSAHQAFAKIIHSSQAGSVGATFSFGLSRFEKLRSRYDTLKKIQESDLDTFSKLALAYHHLPETFDAIKQRFIGVFPQVTDVKLEPVDVPEISFLGGKYPLLQVREEGVAKWIPQQHISAGMYRTIMQLAELFLAPDGTVILIDEFENSLGVNCIDVLTEDLLYHNRRLQFIVTSHHPYIINNITPEHWKIVSRIGGTVTTREADELRIHRSSHEAFLQLLNHEQYRHGIAVG